MRGKVTDMTAQKENLIINKMAEFGFTKYQAKAYITLLENDDISAYEISKRSGVPQSKVYETVNNLVEEGIIIARGENPVHYSPLPLKEFIQRHRSKMEKSLNTLEKELKEVSRGSEIDYMWHFEGPDSCMEKVKNIIEKAENIIVLEIWDEEYQRLCQELQAAADKGVKILMIYYGEERELPGEVYFHRLEKLQEYTSSQGRWLTVLTDSSDCFFGSFSEDRTEGIWSQNQAFMLMAQSFISHDIYIAEIYDKFSRELDREFGPNLARLRARIEDYLL